MTDGFIFYGSFWDAIKDLDDTNRLAVYDAVCRYAITGEEPITEGIPMVIFKLIRPQIDANMRKRENGKRGGRPAKKEPEVNQSETKEKPSENQTESKPEPKVKDKAKAKDKAKVKVKEDGAHARFVPPTLEEVQVYAEERGSKVDPVRFWEYFNTGGWVDSKGQKVKNWKQKFLTWESHGHGARESPKKILQNNYDFDALEKALTGG